MTNPLSGDDWEPLPGTVKRKCVMCRHFFSSSGHNTCANCLAKAKKGQSGSACDDVDGIKPAYPDRRGWK